MKIKLFTLLMLGSSYLYAATKVESSSCVVNNPQSSNLYTSVKWYLDSAEKTALYNEVFHIGLQKITAKAQQQHLAPHQWGVVFDIDETVLNNMQYDKDRVVTQCQEYTLPTWNKFLKTEQSVANPGAAKTTCGVKALGGYAVLISNRELNGDKNIITATENNLKKQGICFDTILFADKITKHDKNSRFNAVRSGDYANFIYTQKLPPLKIIAYFGDNIQDFPGVYQNVAIKQKPDSSYFNKFGEEYFLLPNPIYGSWSKNAF